MHRWGSLCCQDDDITKRLCPAASLSIQSRWSVDIMLKTLGKVFSGTQALPENRGACVITHFWHLASMSPDILGSGKMLSGGPQDMDKAAGLRVPRPGVRSPRTRHWSSRSHRVPGPDIGHLGADIPDPALVISESTFKESALIRRWPSQARVPPSRNPEPKGTGDSVNTAADQEGS